MELTGSSLRVRKKISWTQSVGSKFLFLSRKLLVLEYEKEQEENQAI